MFDKRAGRSESYTYQERDLVKAQDVAQLQTGSFFTIVSEGNVKQGKATILMDSNFTKSTLPMIRDLQEQHLDICFENIKQQAKDILAA